ncbi:MAG: hypothetical protein LBO80_04835 [Treponema sp.]|jgi:hypothetical protein|nr:hypothetical protein [Treponema sp.]
MGALDHALSEYYVYSPSQIFPIGTKPVSISGTTMTLSAPVTLPSSMGISDQENAMLDENEAAYYDYYDNHQIAKSMSAIGDSEVAGSHWSYTAKATGTLGELTISFKRTGGNEHTETVTNSAPIARDEFITQIENALQAVMNETEIRPGDDDAASQASDALRDSLAGEYEKFLTNVNANGGYGKFTFRGTLWEGDGSQSVMPQIRHFYNTANDLEISIQRWKDPANPGEEDYEYPEPVPRDVINPDNAFSFEIASDMSDEIK